MNYSKIKEWVSRHKITSSVLGFFIILFIGYLGLGVLTYVGSGALMQMTSTKESSDFGISQPISSSSYPSLSFPSLSLPFSETYEYDYDDYDIRPDFYEVGRSTELEIKEGSITVESENAESDLKSIEKSIEEKDGYIEVNRKRETSRLLSIYLKVRVPIESFDDFIKEIKDSFETESYYTSNYRIDVRYQTDESDIIKNTLENYKAIREEILEMPPGVEKIELLKMITDEEKNLVSGQAFFQRELTDRAMESDMATVSITIEEKIRPSLWPEDLGDRFRDKINNAIDSIIASFMNILVNSLILAIKVIEYLLYVLIIIVPVLFTWRWFKKIRERMK